MERTVTQKRENFDVNANSKLQEFFIDQLRDLYWAEQKLVKTLPKLSEAATTGDLKTAFSNHLIETESHVSRLEAIFSMIGEQAEAIKCPAMAGIVDEGEEIIDETDDGSYQRDVGLIFAGQKTEHYEIASYGGMVKLAETLGYQNVTALLRQTLEEEKKANNLLSSIAEGGVNERALAELNDN